MRRTSILSAALWPLLCCSLLAQKDRLSGPIDPDRKVVLTGVVRKEAQARYDQGPVNPNLRITGVSLMLKMTAAQHADLEKLLEDQRNPSSPDYHAWLTPDQYADRFGLSPADLDKITAWLRDAGLSVDHVARSRNWILFGGTASQLHRAFGVEIHHYLVKGEMHVANSTAPSIPAALEPVVQTIFDMDDFRPKPPSHIISRKTAPDFTNTSGDHFLSPGDYAVIYDIAPLYAKGINGSGQKIAVIGQTAVQVSDMQSFRSTFSLPASDPQMILVPGSTNPGIVSGDEGEADLDLEWAGATAPNASILFVYSTNVFTSANYAISQALAPVMTLSYGFCEQNISGNPVTSSTAFRTVSQQANAEGITYLASSGDSGSADCDSDSAAVAKSGLSVNMPASIPEVTAVGGTEFNEGSSTAFWSSQGSTSALSYIPEMAWNDSGAGTGSSDGLATTGGGLSEFFTKPAWQTGPGVPADGQRDVPDVSFTASADHDGYIVFNAGKEVPIGGTSASAPAFAGMIALLNQYLVTNGVLTKPGLGNINPDLYNLAQTTTGVFHDVTAGSNLVPCTVGTTNCTTGKMGYPAGPGYDLVTGLGSVDFNNLVTQWGGKAAVIGTTTTLSANPTSISVTGSTTVTATVKAASGSATPAGSVSFSAGNTALGDATLNASGTASVTVSGNILATGANTLKATYSGSTSFGSSSGSTTVTVSVPTVSSAVIPSVVPNPVYQQTPDADGYSWFFTVKLNEIAGVATTLTGFTFTVQGTATQDLSSSISAFFGSANIPAKGTLSAALRVQLNGPGNVILGFTGKDAGGATWTQQITVPFYGMQLSAAMTLTSSPTTEVFNPRTDICPAASPYYQILNLQELNGHEVYLTKFVAAGFDLTANIPTYFKSWRLAPLGSLQAGVCWASFQPQTISYEIDGMDDQGNTIETTQTVPFQAAGASVGTLSVSKPSLSVSVSPGQSANTTLSVNVPSGQQWTLSVFPSNQNTRWLVVSPLSGTGSSTVTVTATQGGFSNGAYTATLVFQSVNTIPQFVNVPVTFVAGPSTGTTITGVANAASFKQIFAPGMIMTVFGTNLTSSSTAMFAPSVPLPLSLNGVTATVNGVPAPFYYASQGQLNIQVPYETPAGNALLAVINNGQVATFTFPAAATAPGIFVDSTSSLVPLSTATRGQVLTLFMTGEGDVTPPIATGATPLAGTPLAQLPAPRTKPFSMTVAGLPVTPLFVGIPYGLVGETQINFTVPANAPLGPQKVLVTSGTNTSVAALINITQ